jgi:hypothetical protein
VAVGACRWTEHCLLEALATVGGVSVTVPGAAAVLLRLDAVLLLCCQMAPEENCWQVGVTRSQLNEHQGERSDSQMLSLCAGRIWGLNWRGSTTEKAILIITCLPPPAVPQPMATLLVRTRMPLVS